jgi:hypothetical protein
MYLVALAWIYVVLMMAVAEAASPNGTVVGAVFTFLGYGVLPLAIVMYIGRAPSRRRMRRAEEARQAREAREGADAASAAQPDGGDHAPGDAVPTVRKEP